MPQQLYFAWVVGVFLRSTRIAGGAVLSVGCDFCTPEVVHTVFALLLYHGRDVDWRIQRGMHLSAIFI